MAEQIHVLVVAHGNMSLDEFQVCLGGMGYHVHALGDSQRATVKPCGVPPDVLLVGIGTAGPESLDLLESMRRQYPHVPLVVVTDPANLHKVVKGVRLGAWDYLVKPLRDEGELDLAIRRVIERARLLRHKRDCRNSGGASLVREIWQGSGELTDRDRGPLDSAGSSVCQYKMELRSSCGNVYGPGCEAVTGFTPRELATDAGLMYRIVLEQDRQRVLDMVSSLVKAKDPLSLEYRICHKNGSLRWVSTTLVPRGERDGYPSWYEWIFVDITEGKRTSESALRFNEELERRVHERTIQLESANEEITTLNNDLLRRSQELEKANLHLESFSYSISHDLRTPLRHVHALSRMLREQCLEALDENGKSYLRFIESGCQRMECLVNDLLNFSMWGLQPLIVTTVQPKDLARDVMDELTADTPPRSVEVIIGDLPACQADIPLLRQVYRNLLGNALKFSRKKALARIEVGSFVRDDETVYFVRDNGAGFQMEFAGKLFGVFQRLQQSTEYEGTGVGLAIAQNIIQRHGGKIWAEAAVDQGATFFFTLARERC